MRSCRKQLYAEGWTEERDDWAHLVMPTAVSKREPSVACCRRLVLVAMDMGGDCYTETRSLTSGTRVASPTWVEADDQRPKRETLPAAKAATHYGLHMCRQLQQELRGDTAC
jgi:gamma-glutamyl-gamma-aminobutyrate hydrolase PuuD